MVEQFIKTPLPISGIEFSPNYPERLTIDDKINRSLAILCGWDGGNVRLGYADQAGLMGVRGIDLAMCETELGTPSNIFGNLVYTPTQGISHFWLVSSTGEITSFEFWDTSNAKIGVGLPINSGFYNGTNTTVFSNYQGWCTAASIVIRYSVSAPSVNIVAVKLPSR